MEAVNPFEARGVEPITESEGLRPRARTQTLMVAATYRLSEEGRKASLVAGGDGRELQEITLPVATNRMHLVNVDAEGRARLKLRPCYSLTADQHVVRDDAVPRFDAPPTIDELLKQAARNHQLERAYHAERSEGRQKRHDRQSEVHQQVAEEFLANPTRRAREHPRPTPRHCYVVARNRVILFDAKRDQGTAQQVPAEAYRRYGADVQARTERNQETSRRERAIHEERKRLIAQWVASHATPDQRQRFAAGMLPIGEVLEGMADQEFAAAGDRPRYIRDGVERLQAHLRQFPHYADIVVAIGELRVTTAHAEEATEPQWALMQHLLALFPDATVLLQRHHLTWTGDDGAPSLTLWGVLVARRVGPFNIRREYLAPSPDDSISPHAIAEEEPMDVFDRK
jgi:hypothetical protein